MAFHNLWRVSNRTSPEERIIYQGLREIPRVLRQIIMGYLGEYPQYWRLLDGNTSSLQNKSPENISSDLETFLTDGREDFVTHILTLHLPPNMMIPAAKGGHLLLIKYLTTHGSSQVFLPLVKAIENNHASIVDYLLTLPIDKQDLNAAMNWTAGSAHLQIFDEFFLYYPEAHWPNTYPYIAFLLAAESGHLSLVKHLLPSPLSSRQRHQGLIYGVFGNHQNIVEYFLHQGPQDLCLPLRYAAERGHLDMVQYLVTRGATNFEEARDITHDDQIRDYLGSLISGTHTEKSSPR